MGDSQLQAVAEADSHSDKVDGGHAYLRVGAVYARHVLQYVGSPRSIGIHEHDGGERAGDILVTYNLQLHDS